MTQTIDRPRAYRHFRTIPSREHQIWNVITRRRFVGGGTGAVLAGVSGGTIFAQGSPDASPSAFGTKTITTFLGTYEIPLQPNRVLAIDARNDLETALVLGLPVVATSLRNPTPWVPASADIQIIDGPIDFEQVAAIQPDLIICAGEDDEWWPTSDLQRFAPVVPTDFESYWKDDLNRVAEWLGRTEQLGAGFAEYDGLISQAKSSFGDALASKRVVYLQYIPDTSTFAVNTEGRLQPQVLADLGGTLFGDTYPYTSEAEISLERIGEFADADGFYVADLAGNGALEALSELPLWSSLPAVKAGHVISSRGNVNYGGIYTAQEIARNWSALYELIQKS